MQVISRFDDDSRKPNRGSWDVVVLERLQRPRRWLLFSQNRVRRRKHLIEVVRADELLLVTNPRRVAKPRAAADALTAISGLLAFLQVLPVPAHTVHRWLDLLRRHP